MKKFLFLVYSFNSERHYALYIEKESRKSAESAVEDALELCLGDCDYVCKEILSDTEYTDLSY